MARQFLMFIRVLKVLLFLMLLPGQAKAQQAQCQKDLLLIVDTSFSIRASNFNKQIKPFLNQLINEKVLNVGQDGTHIALMVFSKKDQTKMVLPFGKVYSKDALSRIITGLDWDKVKGDQTRTDVALKIASEIFSSKSPANYRTTVDDVIVIITDGHPQGVRTASEDAKTYAQDLKNNDVVIIGVGVGDIISQPQHWHILQEISSPGQTIQAQFRGIENILGKLVTKSCENYSGYCTCPIAYGAVYLRPGETKRTLSWEEPTPSCGARDADSLDRTITIVTPSLLSPHEFDAGNHSISYMYFFTNGRKKITCSVMFEIKACPCPAVNLGSVFVEPGASTRKVSWQLPLPQCRASLKAIIPEVKPGDPFSIGPHTVDYVFNIAGNFNVTCKVNFDVTGITLCRGEPFSRSKQECCCGTIHEKQTGFRCCGIDYYQASTKKCCPGANVRNKEKSCFEPGCRCPSMPFIIKYIKPGDSKALVSWELPRPNCVSRLVTVVPVVTPGESFPIGLYHVKYSYRIFNRYDATCQVDFEVKECKCPPLYLSVSVKPGALTTTVYWREPRPDCPEVARKISEPQQKPGEAFTIGQHRIRYVYNINNQFPLVCVVTFQIKGALCRDKGYNVANQECCCGTIYAKVPGFRCCGQDYYQISTKKCCPHSVVRKKEVICPTTQ